MNLKAMLSLVGRWNFSDENIGVVYFYAPIKLVGENSEALVLGGWAFKGWGNTTLYKVNAAVISQTTNGGLSITTNKYLPDASTNGAGSVLVYDFNNDGLQDIFMAAHNESPLTPTPSTAFLSNTDGTFSKLAINDSVEAHSASLGVKDGVATISSTGYGPKDPFYQYNNSTKTFDVKYWGGTYAGSLYGSCSLVSDLDSDGKTELVIGDCKGGPGLDFDSKAPTKLAIYKLEGDALASSPSFSSTLYFDKPQYKASNLVSEFSGMTHNYRVWQDDFNHDGKQDLLLGVGIWSAAQGWQKSKLEMFQNGGALKFTDVTDVLGAAYDENSSYVDYSMQIRDIDHSGINTYLLAGNAFADIKSDKQSNYILLNDGTGKLYAALHNEYSHFSDNISQFIPYIKTDGTISFMGVSQNYELYSLDIAFNPTIDFKDNVMVSDRNNAKLIRTWAGNDTICDANANSSPAHIDGGLGIDRALYSGKKSAYIVAISSDGVHVKSSSVDDTLVNIERIQFADKLVAADIQGNAGQAYRLYKAALDRTPDERGLAGWIKFMDEGGALNTMAQQFINSQEFNAKYGALDNTGFINQLYKNVLARNGEPTGVAGWVGGLNNGLSRAEVLKGFSESAENQANVIGQIKDGIAYVEWWLT